MRRRGLAPSQWRAMPRADRLEMLAYDRLVNERRLSLLDEILKKAPNDMTAQVLALLSGIE